MPDAPTLGAPVAANKVTGLIHDTFSAHQGVEDDDLNMICLGGLVVGPALAWELVRTFLGARFNGGSGIAAVWQRWRIWRTALEQKSERMGGNHERSHRC